MYNPSRGGVRGGADQFTWESVKTDKHRENYLGHSLKAPVGRWQKGKDLSWYAKERKDGNTAGNAERSELASIKQAEEEAMLIALGHNIVPKTQTLSKEDVREALKRNPGERDESNIERIDGVGASSQRVALLSGARKDSKKNLEGVAFEGHNQRGADELRRSVEKGNSYVERKRSKKKSKKKHKKEKKHNKHYRDEHDSDSSNSTPKHAIKYRKRESNNDSRKVKSHKKSHKHEYSSDKDSNSHSKNQKRHKKQTISVKKKRHDTSESD